MKLFFLSILFLFFHFTTFSQMSNDEKLARYYMGKGEYDKALEYTKKLHKKYNSYDYYNMHLTSLKKLEDFKEAEKVIDKQINKYPHENRFQLDLAELYEITDRNKESEEIYLALIKSSAHSSNQIISLSGALRDKGKYDLALTALEEGKKKNKDYPFQFQTSEILAIQGKTEKLINELIEVLSINSAYKNSVQILLTRYLDLNEEEGNEENKELLKISFLKETQKNPNNTIYPEMLIWLYSLEKNFEGALIQAKALDKREKGEGRRLIMIARDAVQANEFAAAMKGYDYVLEKGEKNIYFRLAKMEKINAGYRKLKVQKSDADEIASLIQSYKKALEELGFNGGTIGLIQELAEIQAYYNQSPKEALSLLKKALDIPRLEPTEIGLLKIQLADTYIILDDIWEASLLYSQVEKTFKHDPMGAEAKFKNAKVSYYAGDFSWAQAQLKVLKASTSKLIANDALQLSLLITDNMGLDTTAQPMILFARADLLMAQRKYEEAFLTFDTLQKQYPFHKLHDNILFKKAEANIEQYNYQIAIKFLLEINTSYKHDLLAEDALFLLGKIHEEKLNQPKEAAEYYKKILFEHKGSILVNEARKRYRNIVGDETSKDREIKIIDTTP